MRLFRTRYKIVQLDGGWFRVFRRKWFWKWESIGSERTLDEARQLIEIHKHPTVHEE